jgi:hypothetical protein
MPTAPAAGGDGLGWHKRQNTTGAAPAGSRRCAGVALGALDLCRARSTSQTTMGAMIDRAEGCDVFSPH